MSPFYFGTSHRKLFGVYTPARTGGPNAGAIVLCHPWGPEYLYAHRSMRQLASMLNTAGFHTLRFDYFGTGDSAGDMMQADLRGWEEDIEMAIDELKDMTGAFRVALVGLRLGAILAARVAAKRGREVEALALWDPMVSGNEYLLELLRSASSRPIEKAQLTVEVAETGRAHEIRGFPLTEAMARELRPIDLSLLVPRLPERTLCVFSDAGHSHDALDSLLAAGTQRALTIAKVASPPAWLEDGHSGAALIPVKVLQRIVGWFG